ncbi:hypothetical protein [Pseudomonas sp. EggHat1]|nr:hypothetical protein [Pseudomonas sp. EggHat1]
MPDDSRIQLRNELLAGAASKPAKPADKQYFNLLRQQVLQAKGGRKPPL